MTGLIGKVKEALHSNSKSEQPEGTHGHHNSRAANAADPRIDSDRDHRAAHDGTYTSSDNYTTSGTSGLHSTTGAHTGHTGLHSENRGLDSNASRNDGPHNSNLMNKMDPRVDSDRDHSRNMGANPSGTATTGTSGTHTGTTSGLNTHTGTHSTGLNSSATAGPHSSNLANKADPRVDSDLDRSRNMGMNTTTGTHNTTGTGLHSTTGTTGLNSSTNHGPHDSNLMNKADPRVDSDRDHRGATTGIAGGSAGVGGFNSGTSAHTGTHGTTGLGSSTHGTSTNRGPHDSNLMNKADPRVDSDRDHRAAPGTHNTTGLGSSTHTSTTHGTTGLTGTHAPGPAPNTAGPHKSDMMNKVDPRVDSDLDGSKTYGGDKTYTRS